MTASHKEKEVSEVYVVSAWLRPVGLPSHIFVGEGPFGGKEQILRQLLTSLLRWPVGATVHKNINYLRARDNYLWPGDSFLWARVTISGPEKVSLAHR